MPHGRLPEGRQYCRDRHYNQAIVRHSQVRAAALPMIVAAGFEIDLKSTAELRPAVGMAAVLWVPQHKLVIVHTANPVSNFSKLP
jgi:hypothetical protein